MKEEKKSKDAMKEGKRNLWNNICKVYVLVFPSSGYGSMFNGRTRCCMTWNKSRECKKDRKLLGGKEKMQRK